MGGGGNTAEDFYGKREWGEALPVTSTFFRLLEPDTDVVCGLIPIFGDAPYTTSIIEFAKPTRNTVKHCKVGFLGGKKFGPVFFFFRCCSALRRGLWAQDHDC